MAYLKLLSESHTTTTRDPYEGDDWDRGDSETSWDVRGVRLVPTDEYGAIRVGFDVAPGEQVWAVYAIYSDGDSFGYDAGHGLEFIDAFKSKAKADAAAAALAGSASAWEREDGSTGTMGWKPWDGYFESLDEMRVEPFLITGASE